MEIQSVIDMRREMRQEGVIMAYNGVVSDELMVTLPPEVGRAVSLLYQMQRGQQWARTGVQPRHQQ